MCLRGVVGRAEQPHAAAAAVGLGGSGGGRGGVCRTVPSGALNAPLCVNKSILQMP